MSVSLTSSGLYLEPRVYTASSGDNYGTPKLLDASGYPLNGTWTGCYNQMYDKTIQVASNVSVSQGGNLLQSILRPHFQKERRVA